MEEMARHWLGPVDKALTEGTGKWGIIQSLTT